MLLAESAVEHEPTCGPPPASTAPPRRPRGPCPLARARGCSLAGRRSCLVSPARRREQLSPLSRLSCGLSYGAAVRELGERGVVELTSVARPNAPRHPGQTRQKATPLRRVKQGLVQNRFPLQDTPAVHIVCTLR